MKYLYEPILLIWTDFRDADTDSFRRAVVREYETGDLSRSQLAVKYGLKDYLIRDWKKVFGSDIAFAEPKSALEMTPEEQKEQDALKKELAALKKEVSYLKMKELALETMIDIAKEEFSIDLRKKSGTKPSGV